MQKGMLKIGLLVSTSLIVLGAVENAQAQEVSNGVSSLPGTDEVFVDEVFVTAERRSERIIDVPIALSVFSGEDLADASVSSIEDLRNISPSFQFSQDGGVNIIGMRGVSAGLGVIGAEGAVTVSQNGVTLGRLSLWDANLFDIDRVEVLRGPQGVISGRNATGGAINIHSNLPTDELEGGLKVTVGNYQRYANEGFISGPILNSGIRGRLAFSTDNADGWLRNSLLNETLNDRNKAQVRATFETDISDKLNAVLTLDAIRDQSTRNTGFDRGRIRPDQPGISEFLGVSAGDIDDLKIEADQAHSFDKEQYNGTLRLSYYLGSNATLTSITGYVNQDLEQTYDCDGTSGSFCAFPTTPAFPEGYGFEVSQFSQELTLTADLTDRLDLILGGLYVNDDSKHFNHYTASSIGLVPDSTQLSTEAKLDSYAAYTQLRYQLNEYVRLAAGLRYTKDEKEYSESGQVIFAPGAYTASNSWDAVTPRFAIDVQPSEDLTMYASASRGFRSGGYSITFLGPEDEFDPEFVWSYETGLKANLLDGRLDLALSGFVTDYKNIQQIVFGLDGIGTDTINAAKADITGIELEFGAQLSDEFSIDFSGTWLDAEFAEFRTADPIFTELGEFNPVTGLNVRDLSGNRLPRSPEWKFSISGEYRTKVGPSLMGYLRADYTWQDDMFFGPYNYELAEQESYGLLGLSAGVESDDGAWSLTAFARNVTDERYFQGNSVFAVFIHPTPTQIGLVGEPRQYGLSLGYKF